MKNFLYNINPYAQVKNYLYARKTLKQIVEQKLLFEHYFLEDKTGKPLENPMYAGGSMILEMPLPPNINEVEIESFIKDHSKVMFDSLLKLDLYGIVSIDKKIFLNDEFSEDTDDYGAVILVVRPDIKRLAKTIACLVALLSIITLSIYMIK